MEKIRTLGFYQPFGTLMLFGKIETRWVIENNKPPFPLGKYLFYTTKKECSNMQLFDWAGSELMLKMSEAIGTNKKPGLNGYALGIGELKEEPYWMRTEDETKAFVKCLRTRVVENKRGKKVIQRQWCLPFVNVKRIEPFEWSYGKQGVGFVPVSELEKIKIIQ